MRRYLRVFLCEKKKREKLHLQSYAMEMTFYDDSQFRGGKNDGKALKRPVTLDLDSPNTASKKAKFNTILTSPDLNMLKLRTPELEKFIMANCGVTTPTPTQILFPKSVTEEQENYAKGFIDALNHLHQSVEVNSVNLGPENASANGLVSKIYTGLVPIYLSTPGTTSVIKSLGSPKNSVLTTLNPTIRPPSVDSTNSSSCNSNSMSVPLEFSVKEELQTVPSDFSSPPLSPIYKTPIDMADQERIKLERKRYRNRIAASKCRRRKLEKISQLEAKVKDLKGDNAKLEAFADRLRDQVCSLKQTVLEHVKKGCQIMVHQSL